MHQPLFSLLAFEPWMLMECLTHLGRNKQQNIRNIVITNLSEVTILLPGMFLFFFFFPECRPKLRMSEEKGGWKRPGRFMVFFGGLQ